MEAAKAQGVVEAYSSEPLYSLVLVSAGALYRALQLHFSAQGKAAVRVSQGSHQRCFAGVEWTIYGGNPAMW